MWGLSEQLAAAQVDELRSANWQRGGGKGRRPRPIPRPGIEDKTTERIGGMTTYTVEEMRVLIAERTRGGKP